MVHPITGETITQYRNLKDDPATKDILNTAFGKEFGNVAQGDKTMGTKGTNSMFVLSHTKIRTIPGDQTVTYARIVVDYRPQKSDPNRVRIATGGNLIDYSGELTTRTADLKTSTLVWNSVISTKDARFMGINIRNFYLGTAMKRFEYMKMPLKLSSPHIVE